MSRGERKHDRKADVIDLLSRFPTMTRRELAESLGVSHQYISLLVEELVAEGVLERAPRKARSTRLAEADMKAVSWPM